MKNPQFLPYSYETWPFYTTHELVLLVKFHSNRIKIVDFLLMVYFDPSRKFSSSVSSYKEYNNYFLLSYLYQVPFSSNYKENDDYYVVFWPSWCYCLRSFPTFRIQRRYPKSSGDYHISCCSLYHNYPWWGNFALDEVPGESAKAFLKAFQRKRWSQKEGNHHVKNQRGEVPLTQFPN